MTNNSSSFEHCIEHAELSDVGMRRQNNQDSMNSMVSTDEDYWQRRGHLFLVADGMGAHAAGELASKLAADGIPHTYAKHLDVEPPTALRQAIIETNTQINEKGLADAEFQGMGTTCSALLLLPQGAVVGHVGDSRVYRLRKGQLDQLTFDHSLVWEMQAAGQVSPEAAEMHLPKNIITRSLGPSPKVQVDLEGPFAIEAGDTYLLCSDGLTGPVKDQELGAIIGCLPPDEATRTLVDLANLRGGPDNITTIVVRVLGAPVAQVSESAEEPAATRVHPVLWWVAAVCLLAGIGMYFAGAIIPAALCGIGAIVATIVGMLQRFDKDEPAEISAQPVTILGHGPHRSYACTPSTSMVDELSRVAGELRKTAEQIGYRGDFEAFDAFAAKASEAVADDDFAEAVRQHSHAISFLVGELKKQNPNRATSDSHVDLI